ncbi:MAG: serine/threonine-protein kinase [Gammaproteobacteria bacterium]
MRIPGYTIETEIGRGGMATVYLATQQLLDRKVALKIMTPSLAADDSFCQRFVKEGKTIAQFKHPNIVTIYDIGAFESHYYMAMEYIGGGTLKERIRDGSAVKEPLSVVRQIALALGYAHTRGFIHRDIKPANILFQEDGSAVLSDFGIAKDMASDEQLTRMGFTVGTPEYMSPEQALGRDVDGRSDLYSLGVVFYEMLAGRKPFLARDAFAVALMHANQPPPPLPDSAKAFQPVVDRLLAKDPRERYATAADLLQAIERSQAPAILDASTVPTEVLALSEPPAGPDRPLQRGAEARFSALKRWPIPVAAMALVAAAGVYFYPTLVSYQEPAPSVPSSSLQGPIVDTPRAMSPSTGEGGELSPSVQARVERLLDVAEAHAAIGRLTEPPGSNAYDAYKLVLQIDPQNERAKVAIQTIEREAKPRSTP